MKEKYMEIALRQASKAYDLNEIPVGAVIVKDDQIISKAYNVKEKNNDPCGHAEIRAIKKACKKLNSWRLDDCEMYVTLDPCPMCASAIKQSRISNVYSACTNFDKSNCEIISMIFKGDKTNPEVKLTTNLAENESKELLNQFFKLKRRKK